MVWIDCYIPPNEESKWPSRFPKGLISCSAEISDGMASFIVDGPMCTMTEDESRGPVPPQVAEWLEAAKTFLRDQTDFMIQLLKELDDAGKS